VLKEVDVKYGDGGFSLDLDERSELEKRCC